MGMLSMDATIYLMVSLSPELSDTMGMHNLCRVALIIQWLALACRRFDTDVQGSSVYHVGHIQASEHTL